jgi:hypothetical protein
MSISFDNQIQETQLALSNQAEEMELRRVELKNLNNRILDLENMKINHNLLLSALNKKKLQESIDIKFLPFLPKEINNYIRTKIHSSKYDMLNEFYFKMITNVIREAQIKYGRKIIRKITTKLNEETIPLAENYDENVGLFWEWNRKDILMFDEETNKYIWNIDRINQEDEYWFVSKITNEFEYCINEQDISEDIFDTKKFIYNHLDTNDYYALWKNFKDFNERNLEIYLNKNVKTLINYSLELEKQVIITLEYLFSKIYHSRNTINTQYWYSLCDWKNQEKDLLDSLGFPNWQGHSSNPENMEVKFIQNFISKKKIPIKNKGGRLSNKTNYKLMGEDIMKYYNDNAGYSLCMSDLKSYLTKYYIKIFKAYFINNSFNLGEYLSHNKVDFDFDKFISFCNRFAGKTQTDEYYECNDNYITGPLWFKRVLRYYLTRYNFMNKGKEEVYELYTVRKNENLIINV